MYQDQVLQMFHDGQCHWGMGQTIVLCRECFYCNAMYKDIADYVINCPWCQIAKGHCTGSKTILSSLIANNPLDLLCIDFTRMDPLKDSTEDVLNLIDTFSKMRQVFMTPNQKSSYHGKNNFYGIPGSIYTDKGQSFDNEVLQHLYTLHGIK